ncbi:expressed unknown protein [Seminavis robusta]|uniref:Uncharacterized protein n=1 Tax=Seminavis robusta TaxID=568900 RepID=A0A9N8H935_9STRA|nr:expressed unknown protein [Seminavis robusta]|eukprot:Sro191_g082130.1 n/a (416) ;mRNA; f:22862-24109
MGTFNRAKKVLQKLRKKTQVSPSTEIPTLFVTLNDKTKDVDRNACSLSFQSLSRDVVVTIKKEIEILYDRTGYAVEQPAKNQKYEQSMSSFFEKLGQLPNLTSVTVIGGTKGVEGSLNLRHLTALFMAAAGNLESFTLSNLDVIAEHEAELEEFAGAIRRLVSLRRFTLPKCRLAVEVDAMYQAAPRSYWTSTFESCASLPYLELLEINACKVKLNPETRLGICSPKLLVRLLDCEALDYRFLTSIKRLEISLARRNQDCTLKLMRFLMEYLKKTRDLEELDLTLQAPVHPDCVNVLCEALAVNKSLKRLVLLAPLDNSLPNGFNDSGTWEHLNKHNHTLEAFDIIPEGQLSPVVLEQKEFWLLKNRFFRPYRAILEATTAEMWVGVLSNPDLQGNLSALFYVLSNVQAKLIQSS